MRHFSPKNIVQLFIKFTHSFVVIELLTFCKNAKNYFIAQESSRYSVRKQDWFFLIFVYIKAFRKKKGFVYEWKLHRKRMPAFIYKKQKKLRNVFIYKKPETFQNLDNFRYIFIYKKQYTWRYGIFMKILKLAFIYKKYDTFRYVRFLYTKS